MSEPQNARDWLPKVTSHAELEIAAQVLEKFAEEIERVDLNNTEGNIKNYLANMARSNARILRNTELTK
ncbi:hypothetical protein Pan241w_11010 [Gimesia alba]|uniref:Uncharacterized protein n=1 Tax=Gimesia alba TaxID=2527973 RepID=A0A517RAX9_9PLAN|nr:hypothetical protein [Gimesia alba]QDT41042.1 hypothetical protein Pan241w_11010 [Gimesia alba]